MSNTKKVIWSRFIEETTVGDEQLGFILGRGMKDAIFALRWMVEKHREQRKGLHINSMDLEKACNRVPRQEAWR